MESEKKRISEIKKSLEESITTLKLISQDKIDQILQATKIMTDTLKKGNKILIAGNGGSAADAQHIAAEIVGRYKIMRKGFPAIALTTDTSILTAIGNDFGFNTIFSRQIEALGKKDDLFIALSTSGNSENVIKGVELARSRGIKIIGLTGHDGGKLKELCDCWIGVPSVNTPRIQEAHITIGHIMCEFTELELQDE